MRGIGEDAKLQIRVLLVSMCWFESVEDGQTQLPVLCLSVVPIDQAWPLPYPNYHYLFDCHVVFRRWRKINCCVLVTLFQSYIYAACRPAAQRKAKAGAISVVWGQFVIRKGPVVEHAWPS